MRAAASCVDSTEKKLTIMSNQTVAAALDFACVRNSDNFVQFLDQNGMKCYEEKRKNFLGCFVPFMDLNLLESSPRAQSETDACR